MANLKDHQQAMVDLMASGSGIPASAMRLAHAMHDVLDVMFIAFPNLPRAKDEDWLRAADATTPGLNDKSLSKREKPVKTDSPAKWPTSAEQRVKELENTIRQLKGHNAKLKAEHANCFKALEEATTDCQNLQYHLDKLRGQPEQEPDATTCVHDWYMDFIGPDKCRNCGTSRNLVEQAGCRKDDTQVCKHVWGQAIDSDFRKCVICGATEDIYQ